MPNFNRYVDRGVYRVGRPSSAPTPVIIFSFYLLSMMLIVTSFVLAEEIECDPNLAPVKGQLGYSRRKSRCEGLYEARTSDFLKVISLTVGASYIGSSTHSDIRVTVEPTAHVSKEVVNLRAQALPLRVYYRMDAQIRMGTEFAWPTAEVLEPAGIRANDIGFLAWIEDIDGPLFLPIRVQKDGSQTSRNDQIQLIVRSPLELEWVKWRVYEKKHAHTTLISGWNDVGAVSFRPGEPFIIKLPEKLSGLLVVDLRAKAVNRTRLLPLGVRISH